MLRRYIENNHIPCDYCKNIAIYIEYERWSDCWNGDVMCAHYYCDECVKDIDKEPSKD